MDVGRVLIAIVSVVILTILLVATIRGVYSSMDYKGNPISWNQWNGYKAGAAFILANDAEKSGNSAQEYFVKEKKIVSTSPNPTPDTFLCTNNLQGFKNGEKINIITFGNQDECVGGLSGLNITVYSEEDSSSLKLNTLPSIYKNKITEDVS